MASMVDAARTGLVHRLAHQAGGLAGFVVGPRGPDLARKRLRKLSTNGSSPDGTILSGTGLLFLAGI